MASYVKIKWKKAYEIGKYGVGPGGFLTCLSVSRRKQALFAVSLIVKTVTAGHSDTAACREKKKKIIFLLQMGE